jgi:hypothetical protein
VFSGISGCFCGMFHVLWGGVIPSLHNIGYVRHCNNR